MAPIPITIVTGFLGSGKTTLILGLIPQLRAADPSYRLALLKNEFGDLAVDSQLAGSEAISGVQEMLGGCICCNLVGQLGEALAELATTVRPDRIVVETSGSAFPATLALEVNRLARETPGRYVLDGVVHVIDVENWKGYEDTSYTARMQARYTDLIVLNKWEACDERRLDECLDRVGDLELETPCVQSDKGRLPVELVFGVGGELTRAFGDDSHAGTEGHGHDHSHDHQSEVEVLSMVLQGPEGAAVNADKLQAFLRSAPKDEVYRIKAVLTASYTLRSSEEDESYPTPPHPHGRYILNWAFGRWTSTPVSGGLEEHDSSRESTLRMTMILARYESTKWKKKLENGGLLELDGDDKGSLVVTRIS
ncbi:CobW/HypB/UreG, nucleotide-binding domain-containing protein [Phialemonium atrogriseum]|uniref:CobW/HypB/UreG, nucleotide-binding domain-containing protein n=1 Tax=Phialemonium atrogriseum TaxID=1093897 RepID=A0AAJ0C7K9_9PEZI|nr:CobW/HypB/UreG, nucleotide-binding domain-containing protein [Phialemonium atrogriseum]KAK1770463.1 CobW/HypB/UreG, nucleotide-binding domain-containing protein [Phialemonium atrogriseum]